MPVRCAKFSHNGELLVTASDDMSVHVYDLKAQCLAASFTGHTSWVLSVDCSSDQRHIASGSSDQSVRAAGWACMILGARRASANLPVSLPPSPPCFVLGPNLGPRGEGLLT